MWRALAGVGGFAILAALATAPPLRADDLKAMSSGPVHEAFLSPRRDVEPPLAPRSPPPAVVERPADPPPNPDARWIGGYWEWLPESDRFVWVTGTWRVPPPGRTWIEGRWNRHADGWRRTPGFWSDGPAERIAYREKGLPDFRPPDNPGPPPKPNCYYIPGQYVPEGDGVVWRKGFWAESKPGWAWVPANWIRRPEGWIHQRGYWDRPLEDRGALYAPAEPAGKVDHAKATEYRPLAIVSPPLYGQLYGAFGRSTAWYDGYPGVCYDSDGRYYAYADYGRLAPYYGYLDYPALGGFGYPYYASPLIYGANPPALANGLGPPYFGFGGSLLPLMTGYPLFGPGGILGVGLGIPWMGWNPGPYSWGIPGWSGVALGTWPGFGWGSWGWSGPTIGAWPSFLNVGFPNWLSGWSGYGWGGFGWGGYGWNGLGWNGWGFPGIVWGGNPIWAGLYPFSNSGRFVSNPGPPPHGRRPGAGAGADRPGGVVGQPPKFAGSMRPAPMVRPVDAVSPPPSTRPFAALTERPTLAGMRTAAPTAGAIGAARNPVERPPTWLHSYNAVAPTTRQERRVARPAFSNSVAGGGSVNTPGVGPGPGIGHMRHAGEFAPQLGAGALPSPRGAETLGNPNVGAMRGAAVMTPRPMQPGLAPRLQGAPGIDLGPMRSAGVLPPAYQGAVRAPGFAPDSTPGLGNGFTGGMRQPGGFGNAGNFGAGVYNGGSMFSGGMRSADPGAGPGGMGFGGMRGGPAGGFGGAPSGGFGGPAGGFGGPAGGFGGAPAGGFGGAPAGGGNFGGHMR